MISPVAGFSTRPEGRDDPGATDQLYGGVPPEAARVAEYGAPAFAAGTEVVRIRTGEVELKLAATLIGPVIVRLPGLVVPLKSPEKPVNTYPALGVALTVAIAPELYQPPGVMLPPAAGLAEVVR